MTIGLIFYTIIFKYKLVIDTNLLGQITDDKVFTIKIKLEDLTGSFKIYNLSVTVTKLASPYFNQIQNLLIQLPESSQINYRIYSDNSLINTNLQVQAVDCFKGTNILWITQDLDFDNNVMQIKPGRADTGVYCVNLVAQFTCKTIKKIKSNNFIVSIKRLNHPPSLTNSIPEIILYTGQESKEIILPDHLFTDIDGDDLSYISTNCIESNSIYLGTTIQNVSDSSKLYLFIKAFKTKNCQISIIATDPEGQSCSAYVDVKILNCASKDCSMCDGPLQIDCLKCIEGYVLDDLTGSCLEKFKYQSFYFNSFYKVLGFSTFLMILIPIFASKIYGKITLYPILFIQIIIAVMNSNGVVSSNIRDYLEWLQIYKLDFGFLNIILKLNQTWLCTSSNSENLNGIQMYCEGFVINFTYFLAICFALLILKVIIMLMLQKCSNEIIHYCYIKLSMLFSREFVLWCIPNILFVFPSSLILIDILQTKRHTINSLLSIFVLILIAVYIALTRFDIISIMNISSNESEISWVHPYFFILRNICVVFLFCFEHQTENNIWILLFFIFQLTITVYTIILLSHFSNKKIIISTIFEISIIMITSYYKIQISIYKSVSQQFNGNIESAICMFTSGSIAFSTVVIIWPNIKAIKMFCKLKLENDQK